MYAVLFTIGALSDFDLVYFAFLRSERWNESSQLINTRYISYHMVYICTIFVGTLKQMP